MKKELSSKDCADSRAVATFETSSPASSQSSQRERLDEGGDGRGHPQHHLKAVLVGLAARSHRLAGLDIVAADAGQRRPDIGVLGAAENDPAVDGSSTQSLVPWKAFIN